MVFFLHVQHFIKRIKHCSYIFLFSLVQFTFKQLTNCKSNINVLEVMKCLHYKMHHDAETEHHQESAAHVDC